MRLNLFDGDGDSDYNIGSIDDIMWRVYHNPAQVRLPNHDICGEIQF